MQRTSLTHFLVENLAVVPATGGHVGATLATVAPTPVAGGLFGEPGKNKNPLDYSYF